MPKRTSLLTAASIVSASLLLAFVGLLLVNNYLSQASLRATLLERFEDENERLARDLTTFFNNRREELFSLAASRVIEVFFKNRALGMSMEYGLRQSLPPIKEKFAEIMERNRIGSDEPYERFMLIDEAGRVLVDVRAQDGRGRHSAVPASLREPRHRETFVLAQNGGQEVLFSRAYYFNDRYAGQLLAWVRTQFLFDYVLRHHSASPYRSVLLYGNDVIAEQPDNGPVSVPPVE